MRRIARPRLYITIIVTFLIEATWLNIFRIGPVMPDLMLLLMIFIGLHSGSADVFEGALACGILRGCMTSSPVALHIVTLGICGFIALYCRGKVYRESVMTQVAITFFIAAVFNGLNLFAGIADKGADPVNIYTPTASLFTLVLLSIYTSIFSPPAFFCLSRAFKFVKRTRF